jgi:hypothetical protein
MELALYLQKTCIELAGNLKENSKFKKFLNIDLIPNYEACSTELQGLYRV